jgi:5'-nucleotidase
MSGPKPLILVSNDDGVTSPWLLALRAALRTFADVVVVAPEHEQSATSHAISLHRSLRLKTVADGIYSLDGTPADCVYVALYSEAGLLPRKPDLIASGVNRGLNLGQDAFYSGTIAAAREGALRGILGLAMSAEVGSDIDAACAIATKVAKTQLARRASPLLSVNVPKNWNGQLQVARLGKRIYDEVVMHRADPRGRDYIWLGGPGVKHDDDPGADTHAFDLGFATLTELSLDLTQNLRAEEADAYRTLFESPPK